MVEELRWEVTRMVEELRWGVTRMVVENSLDLHKPVGIGGLRPRGGCAARGIPTQPGALRPFPGR